MTATQATLTRPQPSMAAHPALRPRYRVRACHVGAMSRSPRGIPPGTLKRGTPGVGERIRAARKAAGLTIVVLAERAGVDKGSLTVWELGNRDLMIRDLLKVAAALDVPPESLLPPAPLSPQMFAGSLECPGCGMQAGVLMTAMPPPRKPIQDRSNERNAR